MKRHTRYQKIHKKGFMWGYRFGKLLPGNHKLLQGSVNKLRKGVGKKRHLNFHTW